VIGFPKKAIPILETNGKGRVLLSATCRKTKAFMRLVGETIKEGTVIPLITRSQRKSNVFQHLSPQPTQSAQLGMAQALSQQGWQQSPRSWLLLLVQS
jgi:hypothetical protein